MAVGRNDSYASVVEELAAASGHIVSHQLKGLVPGLRVPVTA
jgi:hypothetical protein